MGVGVEVGAVESPKDKVVILLFCPSSETVSGGGGGGWLGCVCP